MSKLSLLSAVVALCAASAALAASPGLPAVPTRPMTSAKPVPRAGAITINPCSAYGPNFARVDGTDTCVKIGGAVSVGAGTSSFGR